MLLKKYLKFLTKSAVFLLLIFIALASIYGAAHSFSHQNFVLEKNTKNAQNLQAQNKYLAKFFAAGFAKKHQASKATTDCATCFLFSLQNIAFFNFKLIFFTAFFISFLLWRNFDRVKSSYLLNSFLSRAPPAIS